MVRWIAKIVILCTLAFEISLCNLLVMLQFNCLITDLAIGFAFNADDEVA